MLYPLIINLFAAALANSSPRPGQDAGCPRSTPEPVVRKAVFGGARFQLGPDRRRATETVQLGSGPRLRIEHTGCEYYTLNFRFEGQASPLPADARAWYRQAAALLRQAAPGIEAPVNLTQAAGALSRAAQAPTAPRLGQELVYRPGDMPPVVTVQSARRTSGRGYRLDLSLRIGPL